MHLFYLPGLEHGQPLILLDEAESKHAVRVLRLSAGDQVQVVDGRGGFYEARIEEAHPKKVLLSILSVQTAFQRLPYRLHIAVAPTKNIERIEWFLEKATEIGITEVTPLICERSERREVKTERLERVAVSAMKQSVKAHLPRVNEAVRFSRFLELLAVGSDGGSGKSGKLVGSPAKRCFIAHCEPGEKAYINALTAPGEDVLVLIGPEGDFSPEEIRLAEAAGFVPVSLGDSRLRTETAGLAACMEVSLLNR